MEEKKFAHPFPHVKGTMSTANIMRMVLVALVPAAVSAVLRFGVHALLSMLFCMAACVVTEFAFEAFADRPLSVADGSSAVTGLLLALMLPVKAPLWLGPVGGVFAIAVIKMAFGGLGKNRLNPALSGYCLLLILFSDTVRNYSYGSYGTETILGLALQGEAVDPLPLLLGNTNGGIGLTSALAVLIGFVILLAFGIVRLRIPAACFVSFIFVLFVFGGHGFDQVYLTVQICGGGFLAGICFMATDYVTSPITKGGQILYGILIGTASAALRIAGIEEAVVYAVLLGNLFVPFLEKVTVPKAFGQRKMVKVPQKN